MIGRIIVGVAGAIAVVVVVALLMAIPVWLLWNWLMPIIFGLPELTLPQALGVLLMSGFLFKSSSSSSK